MLLLYLTAIFLPYSFQDHVSQAFTFTNQFSPSVASLESLARASASNKLCTTRNESRYSSWLAQSTLIKETITVTRTTTFQTIESFGLTSVYTPCDGIPHVRFLDEPTHSKIKNVTVARTWESFIRRRASPTGPKDYWDTIACDTISTRGSIPSTTRNEDAAITTTPNLPSWDSSDNYETCPQSMLDMLSSKDGSGINTSDSKVSMRIRCKISTTCDILVDEEVLLLYWPPTVSRNDSCSYGKGDNDRSTVTLRGNYTNSADLPLTYVTNAFTFKGRDLYEYITTTNYHFSTITGTDGDILTQTSTDLTVGRDPYTLPSVLLGQWTLTWPTLYVAHRPMTAMTALDLTLSSLGPDGNWVSTRSFSNFPLFSAGVFALAQSDLFSIDAFRPSDPTITRADGLDYAQQVALGRFNTFSTYHQNQRYRMRVSPFNMQDLDLPIPATEYYDARHHDCWGSQTHCGTITDDNYRPHLSLHDRAWRSLLGEYISTVPVEFRSCNGPALVDPPIALKPLEAVHSREMEAPPAPPAPSWAPVDLPVTLSTRSGHKQWQETAAPESRVLPPGVKPTPSTGPGFGTGSSDGSIDQNSRNDGENGRGSGVGGEGGNGDRSRNEGSGSWNINPVNDHNNAGVGASQSQTVPGSGFGTQTGKYGSRGSRTIDGIGDDGGGSANTSPEEQKTASLRPPSDISGTDGQEGVAGAGSNNGVEPSNRSVLIKKRPNAWTWMATIGVTLLLSLRH